MAGEAGGALKHRLILTGIGLAAVLLMLAGGYIGMRITRSIVEKEQMIKEETQTETFSMEEILLPASDLVSMKYHYTDAGVYENYKQVFGKKVPFTSCGADDCFLRSS